MAIERTFSMIKPDAMARNLSSEINTIIEKAGFYIIAQKRTLLTQVKAKKFYEVHKDKPFYHELWKFIASGPVLAQVLQKDNAIADYRKLMGATNPQEAADGTLRKKYGATIGENAVHGSDGPETAQREISFFFSELEMFDFDDIFIENL